MNETNAGAVRRKKGMKTMERNNTIYEHIPLVPLRGLVVLPGELLHFDAGRQGSVKALAAAALCSLHRKRM